MVQTGWKEEVESMMRFSKQNRPPGRREGPTRKGWGRRLLVILPGGCLSLVVLVLITNWITIRTLRGPVEIEAGSALVWEESFGSFEASRTPPTIASMSGEVSTFLLPEVLSVRDAVEDEEGWILLDRRLGKIHFVHAEKGLTRSLGREGEGPGELQRPVALALQDTLLWVVNKRGFSLDLFSISSGFLARRRISGGGCLAGLANGLKAPAVGEALFMRFCPATVPGPGTAWVESLSPEGELTPVLSLPLGEEGSRRIHPLRQPAFSAGGGEIYFGTWDAPCIMSFSPKGERHGRFCLPAFQRGAVPEEDRSLLEKRFRSITRLGLLPMKIPDLLPWYDAVFPTSLGPVLRRVRTDADRDLVLLFPDGTSSVTEALFPQSTFVGERSILVARDLLQGTEIRIYPNPWTR